MNLGKPVTVVSLSHVNDPATTPLFPGDPAFTVETVFTVASDGYYLQSVRQGEHTGTHWGAPAHFQEGGLTADELDPGDLFLPAVKIDIRAKARVDADYALTVQDILKWEHDNGQIPDEAAIILWTGWGSSWGTSAYRNADSAGVTHQPGFSVEAVEWLLDRGRLGIRGALGSDTFGPDVGTDVTFAVSRLLYRERRISLENLNNLAALPERGAWVLAGGTINKGGSGSPATIFGLLPRS